MSYNHGREERKWQLWIEAEERTLRRLGVGEDIIEQIRVEDRATFNSNRRFYTHQQEIVCSSAGATYVRLDHLRKKLKNLICR